MPGEIDLRPGIVARAFKHRHLAFAELAMEHIHSTFQAMRRRAFLRRHGRIATAGF